MFNSFKRQSNRNLYQSFHYHFAQQTKIYFMGSDSISVSVVKKLNQKVKQNTNMSLTCITYSSKEDNQRSQLAQYAENNQIDCWELMTKQNKENDFLQLQQHIMNHQQNQLRDKKDEKDQKDEKDKKSFPNTIGIICSFGYMIPEKIINEMGEYFFVIHPSLLPLYRGAAPIQHALLNGESTSGVSVITVSQDRFDAGQILSQQHFDIHQMTYIDLLAKVEQVAGQMVAHLLDNLDDLWEGRQKQDEEGFTPAPKLFIADSYVDWNRPHSDIYNQYRALSGSSLKSIRTVFNGSLLLLTKLQPPSPSFLSQLSTTYPNATTGSIWCGTGKGAKALFVKCGDGWLTVEKILLHARREESSRWFISQFLDKAKIKEGQMTGGVYFFGGDQHSQL